MALTPEQIAQYRAYINRQYGGNVGSASDGYKYHAYGTDPSATGFNFDNGDFKSAFIDNTNTTGLSGRDIGARVFGAGQALGLSDADLAQVLGVKDYEINDAQALFSPDQLSSYGRTFMADNPGYGDASLVRDSVDTSGTQTLRRSAGDPSLAGYGGGGGNAYLGLDPHGRDGHGAGSGPGGTGPFPGMTTLPMTDYSPGPAPQLQQYSANPYLTQQLKNVGDQITRQFNEQVIPGIRDNFVSSGTYGGAKQGVAEGLAARGAAEAMQTAGTNLLYGDYTNAQNRYLQQYGMDQQYGLGQGQLQNNRYAANQGYNLGQGQLGLGYTNAANTLTLGQGALDNQATQIGNQYALGNQGQMLDFYTQQRGLDQSGTALGATLFGQGVSGPWGSLTSAGNILNGASGQNTNINIGGDSGGGWQGALGGGIAGAGWGHQMGWW